MGDANKILSIITINRNNRSGLELTLKSVLGQICRNEFEWVVIDGCSTDGSAELLKSYDDEIDFWVSERDDGIYNAMNKGIVNSNGKFLLFLNSGDYLFDNSVISEVLPYLSNSDFYIGSISLIGVDDTPSPILDHTKLSKEQIIDKLLFKVIPHPATFINRDVFVKEGLYDEKYNVISDWIFFYNSLFLKNYCGETIPLTISYFDTNGISSTNSAPHQNDFKRFRIDNPGISLLNDFYKNNFELIKNIHRNKLVYLMVRIIIKIDKLIERLTKFS